MHGDYSWQWACGTTFVCSGGLSFHPTPVLVGSSSPSRHIGFPCLSLPAACVHFSTVALFCCFHHSLPPISILTLRIDILLCTSSGISTLPSQARFWCLNMCALKIDIIIDLCEIQLYFSTFLCFYVVSGYRACFRKNTSDFSFKIIKLFLI